VTTSAGDRVRPRQLRFGSRLTRPQRRGGTTGAIHVMQEKPGVARQRDPVRVGRRERQPVRVVEAAHILSDQAQTDIRTEQVRCVKPRLPDTPARQRRILILRQIRSAEGNLGPVLCISSLIWPFLLL
jgi:hypothetical protein